MTQFELTPKRVMLISFAIDIARDQLSKEFFKLPQGEEKEKLFKIYKDIIQLQIDFNKHYEKGNC